MYDLDLTPGQAKLAEIILPEEVWAKILSYLTHPDDVLNTGKTCTLFKRLLGSKMVEANLAKTLPLLMKYIDDKTILNCRLVSKGWRDVVDNFFENYVFGRSTLEPVKELGPFPITQEYSALYAFGTKYNVNSDYERFMREMKDHPRNPFVGRAVHFALKGGREADEDRQDFRTVYNFFEIFGKHIWTLELDIADGIQTEVIFPFIIRDVFDLSPNLRSLYIKGHPMGVSMSEDEIRALAPPPALEKLQISISLPALYRMFFHLDHDTVVEKVEKAMILRHSNTQLSVLHTRKLDPLRNLNFLHLKELHFTKFERISELDVLFRNLSFPKLELLSIALGKEIEHYVEWRKRGQKKLFMKFFLALRHLCTSSPNLKTLRFGSTWLWDKDSDQPVGFARGQPCPENIKTLEIPEETIYYAKHEFHATSDYSFLLRFPHVENIHVYKDDEPPRGHRSGAAIDSEIVEVHKFMYSGRMYESNIWKLLPSLKVFSYGEKVYTRRAYERRCLAEPKVPKQK